MLVRDWNIENVTGYKPMTTYYMDFSIADKFGKSAILDTYRQAVRDCKSDYKLLTELVMVLNWKIWEHEHDDYAYLYNELWMKLDAYACKNLQGDELRYFYMVTD